MSNTFAIWMVSGLLWAAPQLAGAQWFYQFTFQGTRTETNSAGAIKSYPVTEKTLLKEIANAAGVTNTSWMTLAYHVRGTELGDTIEVINATNGVVLDPFIGLYFGQAFARVGLTNSAATEERRIEYIYTKQDSHSMGAAFITKRHVAMGPNLRPGISGRMDWVVRPERGQGTKLYSGTFKTGKVLNFQKP